MKKPSRIKAFTGIIAFWCFVFTIGLSGFKTSSTPTKLGSEITTNSETLTTTPTPFSSHLESSVSVLSIASNTSTRNHFNGFTGNTKAIELLHFNTISKYILYSNKISGHLEPTDIIFPFHYFW